MRFIFRQCLYLNYDADAEMQMPRFPNGQKPNGHLEISSSASAFKCKHYL